MIGIPTQVGELSLIHISVAFLSFFVYPRCDLIVFVYYPRLPLA